MELLHSAKDFLLGAGGAAVMRGDLNGDFRDDVNDFVLFREFYDAVNGRALSPQSQNDGSPSGYNTWRTNFGRTSGSGAGLGASAAVPEPSAALLGVLGMMLMMTPLVRKSARR
jgi:hypothetical protein